MRYVLPVFASGGALLCAGALVIPSLPLGPLSTHMIVHIGSMNVVAPLLAGFLVAISGRFFKTGIRAIWLVTGLQIAALWVWHLPVAQRLTEHAGWGTVLMHGSLFAAALMFWAALLHASPPARWHSVLALLVTGKLACLLAALLVFAPRTLYAAGTALAHHGGSLEDQQLAGLLMITACPLSYVLAGIIMAAQAIGYFQPAVQNAQSA